MTSVSTFHLTVYQDLMSVPHLILINQISGVHIDVSYTVDGATNSRFTLQLSVMCVRSSPGDLST